MKNLFLTLFVLFFIISCDDKKTRIQILIDNNCKDFIDDNEITFRIEKVGGGYKSGRFSVQVGSPNGTIIDLPKGGTYNVRGYNYNGLFDLVGTGWKGSLYVEDNKTVKQKLHCDELSNP